MFYLTHQTLPIKLNTISMAIKNFASKCENERGKCREQPILYGCVKKKWTKINIQTWHTEKKIINST